MGWIVTPKYKGYIPSQQVMLEVEIVCPARVW